jgi:hypothetical protein
MDDHAPRPDPRKVRQGLAIIAAVVMVAVVLLIVLDEPLAKAVMLAVALSGFVRAYLLSRSLRAERKPLS